MQTSRWTRRGAHITSQQRWASRTSRGGAQLARGGGREALCGFRAQRERQLREAGEREQEVRRQVSEMDGKRRKEGDGDKGEMTLRVVVP